MGSWEKCTWPFDAEYAKRIECWRHKAPCGYIYLTNARQFQYTVSCDPNSQYSWTGCHSPDVSTIEEAMVRTIEAVNKSNGWELK